MITITLSPELERVVTERAEKQGTTPELYSLEDMNERYLSKLPTATEEPANETMADFFEGYAGTVNSREMMPEGAHLSKDTGRKFKELMLRKYREGKL